MSGDSTGHGRAASGPSDVARHRGKRRTLAVTGALAIGIVGVLLVVFLVSFGGPGLGEARELAREGESLQERALDLSHLADDLEADGRAEVALARREEARALGARADALFAGAEEILDGAGRGLGPSNPALEIMRGVIAFHRGDYARARELLGTARDAPAGPSDRGALLVMLGTIARDSGDYRRAVRLFKQAAESAPENANAHFELGAACLAADSPEEALPALERAAELAASDGAIQNMLGIAYERMLRFDRAESALARAALLEPERLDFRRDLEELRKAKAAENDIPAAWKAFEEGLEHETAAWRGLEAGRGGESVAHLIRAAEAYRAAITNCSNFHAAHYHIGRCYAAYGGGRTLIRERREYFEQAVEHFRAALTGRPNWPPYRFALARALRDLGRTYDAKEVLRGILRDNPRCGKAHYKLAYIFAYADEHLSAAREELAAARRLGVKPDPVFLQTVSEIEAEQQAEPPTEEEKEARLVAEAAMGEGDILLASGDPAGAARAYSRACEVLSGSKRRPLVLIRAGAAERAAVAFERLEDFRCALASYRTALELRPANRDFRENVSRLEAVVAGLEGRPAGPVDTIKEKGRGNE